MSAVLLLASVIQSGTAKENWSPPQNESEVACPHAVAASAAGAGGHEAANKSIIHAYASATYALAQGPATRPPALPSRRQGHSIGRMPPIAVILVDHGSRQPEAAAALAQVAQMAAQRLGLPVETAHLEIGQPTLDEAIDRTIAGGVSQIIVCPYFLAAGRHSQVDIPHVLSAARERHAGVKIQLAEPLGADALLAELIARRIRPLLPDGKSV
jgi:hypothetical protein